VIFAIRLEGVLEMKTLLVMRHAKSSWDDSGVADLERPLNTRGKRDAPRMGRLIREEEIVPDLIVASPARRTRLTAEAVADQSGYEGEIEINEDLYAADAETHLEVLRGLPDQHSCVLIVGHNPGLEELVEHLTDTWERLPTAALVQISLPLESWQDMQDDTEGKLIQAWRPRELP